MTTILDAFADVVAQHGPKPAIIEANGKTASFEELEHRTNVLASEFSARGIGHGDKVLLAMPVGITLYACLAALWRLGAVVVFPEPAMGLAGVRHAARVTQPKAFLATGWYRLLGWFLPELRALPMRIIPLAKDRGGDAEAAPQSAISADDIALVSFTSGSTGVPKAIARSHAFMMAQSDAIRPLLRPGPDGGRDLVAFPVFVLVCLALGVTSVLPAWKLTRQNRASAQEVHDQIRRFGVTRLLVPPVICETLSRAGSLPNLNTIFTGGGPVFPDTLNRLAGLSPGLRMVAVYGSTEAEPIAHLEYSSISADDLTRMKAGGGLLAGTPVPQVDVRIEGGEILVAGPHVNESYLDTSQNPETKQKHNGRTWHRTGDAGQFDDEGRLWLLGRTQARVSGTDPFAVETAARFWPGAYRSALAEIDGKSVLAVAGDAAHLPHWKKAAHAMGVHDVRHVVQIPLDRRHGSKTDYTALKRMLGT